MGKQARQGNRQAQRRAEREAALRALRRKRQRPYWISGLVVLVGAVVALSLVLSNNGGSGASSPSTGGGGTPILKVGPLASLGPLRPYTVPTTTGSEGIPVPTALPLAPVNATTATVDGIQCNTHEQLLFHIHAHLTILVNGTPQQIPYGIGVPGAQVQTTPQGPFVTSGACFSWLHTHAPDGIIHIESPIQRTYTLGDFFDIWGQPLSGHAVGPALGHVTAFYNGKLYEGNPRNIPLNRHAQVQLDVGAPLVAPAKITSWHGL